MTDGFGYDLFAGVEVVLQLAKGDIQRRMADEDINASGRTSASFRVVKEDGHIMLVMGGEKTAPLQTLEVGRPAGNVPGGFVLTKAGTVDVSNTFKAILIQWAKDKGIPDFGWGHATMLGRRIAREGTIRHSRPVDVYTSIVLDVADKVKADAVRSITTAINNQLRRN